MNMHWKPNGVAAMAKSVREGAIDPNLVLVGNIKFMCYVAFTYALVPSGPYLELLTALLRAGARPCSVYGETPVSVAINAGMTQGKWTFWDTLLSEYDYAGFDAQEECTIGASCVPMQQLWLGLVFQRDLWLQWMLSVSTIDGAIETYLERSRPHYPSAFSALGRSWTFGQFITKIKNKTKRERATVSTGQLSTIFSDIYVSFAREIALRNKLSIVRQLTEAGRPPLGAPLLHVLLYDGQMNVVAALSEYADTAETARQLLHGFNRKDPSGRTPLHHLVAGYGLNSTQFASYILMLQRLASTEWSLTKFFALRMPDNDGRELELYSSSTLPAETSRQTFSAIPSGGWPTSGSDKFFVHECSIATLDAPADQAVFEDFLFMRRPLVLRGEVANSSSRDRFKRTRIVQRYGEELIVAGRIPYADAFGIREKFESTLEKYVDYMENVTEASPWYIFQTMNTVRQPDMSFIDGDIKLDNSMMDRLSFAGSLPVVKARQFFLGPRSAGAPVHTHTDAANYLMYGRKRWRLYPPNAAFYSTLPAFEAEASFFTSFFLIFLQADDARAGGTVPPLECVQGGGDMLFIPSTWAHATLNLEASVGLAAEFVFEPGLTAPH